MLCKSGGLKIIKKLKMNVQYQGICPAPITTNTYNNKQRLFTIDNDYTSNTTTTTSNIPTVTTTTPKATTTVKATTTP